MEFLIEVKDKINEKLHCPAGPTSLFSVMDPGIYIIVPCLHSSAMAVHWNHLGSVQIYFLILGSQGTV